MVHDDSEGSETFRSRNHHVREIEMTEMSTQVANARSLLVVPGHRQDRFDKALKSGADVIMLDLEDAVGPDLKTVARKNIDDWLGDGGQGIVRINGMDSPWYEEDIAMLAGRQCAVMLPKVPSAEHITCLLERLVSGSCVVPALETAAGILAAEKICAVPGVVRVVLGNADLASELGIHHADWSAFQYARSHMVLASAVCGVAPPLDGVTASINDLTALTMDARRGAELGFGGKACLHPRQVPVVNEVFSPSVEDSNWARDVVSAAGDGSVAVLNGQVIGKPVVDRARWLLSRRR